MSQRNEVEEKAEMPALYLEDESFVKAWEKAEQGVYPIFPTVDFATYPSLTATLFQSYAGRIPVLHMKEREDFERLLCDIYYKGERRSIPASMGASAIKGWKDVTGQPHRVLLLSDGYYSNIPPEKAGFSPEDWKQKSYLLRRAHECTHYYTLRAYGFMNNALRDELIADATALIQVFGEFRRDLFLLFMGLESYPDYRKGGRLENYLPRDREATAEEWQLLQEDAWNKSLALARFLDEHPEYLKSQESRKNLLDYLCTRKLEDLDVKDERVV